MPSFPPSSPGPRTLTPPTRSHTIPEASDALPKRRCLLSGACNGCGTKRICTRASAGTIGQGAGPTAGTFGGGRLGNGDGTGKTAARVCPASGPVPRGSRQRLLSPRCSLRPPVSARRGAHTLAPPAAGALARGSGSEEELPRTLLCTVRPRPKWPCKCGCLGVVRALLA